MKEFTYTVTDSQGIHARPAGELMKTAKALAATVTIAKGSKSADAESLQKFLRHNL